MRAYPRLRSLEPRVQHAVPRLRGPDDLLRLGELRFQLGAAIGRGAPALLNDKIRTLA
jgi:hypothetical protein